jgi:hypothetical protein
MSRLNRFSAFRALFLVLAMAPVADASVEYTCKDVPSLEMALARLRTSCPGGGTCRSISGSADTPSKAIDACVKAGNNLEACARNVTCSQGLVVCRALGFGGDSIPDAIARCQGASPSKDLCARSIECTGKNYQICTASVFTGHTIEEAVKFCVASGMAERICAANVRCEQR